MDIGGNSMTIGEKIYTMRNQAHMTQEELAEKMGVSRQSVSKWESGASVPELEKLRMLSALFGISIGELINPDQAAKEKEEADTGSRSGEEAALQTEKGRADENPREEYPVNKENETAQAEQAALLKKKIKNLKTVSVIQSACIIVLTAAILVNSFTMVGLSRRIREAQTTAENALNSRSVAYITSDSGEDSSRNDPFEDVYAQIQSLDAEAHTMQVDFTVIPQSTTADTVLSLLLTDENGNDTEIALEDNKGRYTAQAVLPIASYPDGLIVMENADARQTYQTYFDELINLKEALLPHLRLYADMAMVTYNEKKQTLSGSGTLSLGIDPNSEFGYYITNALDEAYELDRLTIRICADICDDEGSATGERTLWEESLDAGQLENLADPEKGVTLDFTSDIGDYHGERLFLEMILVNHYLQEEKNFESYDMLEYGADSTGSTYVMDDSGMELVSEDW